MRRRIYLDLIERLKLIRNVEIAADGEASTQSSSDMEQLKTFLELIGKGVYVVLPDKIGVANGSSIVYVNPNTFEAARKIAKELPPQTIQHFDLWNENVAQLSKQRAFRLPAVFIEFDPYQYGQAGGKVRSAEMTIRLHILTGTLATAEDRGKYQSDALERFALIEAIDQALVSFAGIADERGLSYSTFAKWESITDHNHEQICEDIEVWRTIGYDASSVNRGAAEIAGVSLNLNETKA